MLSHLALPPAAAARILALLLVAAAASPSFAASSKAFVFGTDWTTGSLSAVDLAPRTNHCDVAGPGSDASLRYHAGRLYVVNRFGGDNVQVVDPVSYATGPQFSVGNGSNPHDIAFASATRAYVTRFESADLWIVNPQSGAHTGTISLAAFADADGVPEMDRMVMVGPLLFISLQRVNRPGGFVPTDTALVAVVDTRADTLVDCDPARPGTQAIRLQLTNPATTFQFDAASSRLLIGCAGHYGALDGGIEWLDPVHLASGGVAITEAELGGDVSDVVWNDAQKSYAIVADLAGNTALVRWRAADGTTLGALWSPGGYSLSDAERNDRGELWVCRNSFGSPALRVYDIATDTPSGADLLCTLPPVAVTFDAPSAQVAGVEGARAESGFAPAAPNPARDVTRFAAVLPAAAEVRLEIFDAAGRRVRRLAGGEFAAGAHEFAWDLRDDAGAPVPAGLYLARFGAGGATRVRRVVALGR
ncbi:MAG: hypothetical protein IT347_04360 [Candidatus Eisenbacteria bacterium]|nr:hypothetical protein [Candidatus Eisenbacteria bacterium]